VRATKPIFALLAIASLSACAPTVWTRPGTTQAELNMDRAQCQLVAEGANPGRDVDTIHTGHFKRDLAANAAAGIVSGIAQGIEVGHTASLCMEAKGYMPADTGAVVSAPPPPMPAIAVQAVPQIQAASAVPLASEPPSIRPAISVSAAPIAPEATCPNGRWTEDVIGSRVRVCNAYRASYTR